MKRQNRRPNEFQVERYRGGADSRETVWKFKKFFSYLSEKLAVETKAKLLASVSTFFVRFTTFGWLYFLGGG